jgi:hypothetical protein
MEKSLFFDRMRTYATQNFSAIHRYQLQWYSISFLCDRSGAMASTKPKNCIYSQ